jgi:hypothetical protein
VTLVPEEPSERLGQVAAEVKRGKRKKIRPTSGTIRLNIRRIISVF